MRKYNTFEDFLKTLVSPHERTIIPGTIKREEKEFIYFADDGSGDFKTASKFIEDPCERDSVYCAHLSKPIGLAEYRFQDALPENFKTALPTIEEIEAELAKNLGGEDE